MSEKILIIDDEQDIADLLEVYLKNENYIVYKFYCATDAMPCIESGDIDLAILDIMLPDMNGFSLLNTSPAGCWKRCSTTSGGITPSVR